MICSSFIVGNLSLIIRLEADYKEWITNVSSIQQRFCLALCKVLKISKDFLRLESIEEGSVILHINISAPCNSSSIKQISGFQFDTESFILHIQGIQECCSKFNCRIDTIVAGKYALPIENYLMSFKWKKMRISHSQLNDKFIFDSFDPENKESLCVEGRKNCFTI